ncbi:MAG: DNA repair protein RadC [Deferribacterales bacterium]
MKEHYLGHRKRLKERFKVSPESLADYEILELLLGYVIKGRDVKPESKALLTFVDNNFNKIFQKDIKKVNGIGEECKFFFDLLNEFYRRIGLQKIIKDIRRITSPMEFVDYFRHEIGVRDKESFVVVALNGANEVVDAKVLFDGTVDNAFIHIREIVEFGIMAKAVGMIVAHNHPSGRKMPSNNDIKLTKRLMEALNLVEIKLLDHIIVTIDDYTSMVGEGFLKESL